MPTRGGASPMSDRNASASTAAIRACKKTISGSHGPASRETATTRSNPAPRTKYAESATATTHARTRDATEIDAFAIERSRHCRHDVRDSSYGDSALARRSKLGKMTPHARECLRIAIDDLVVLRDERTRLREEDKRSVEQRRDSEIAGLVQRGEVRLTIGAPRPAVAVARSLWNTACAGITSDCQSTTSSPSARSACAATSRHGRRGTSRPAAADRGECGPCDARTVRSSRTSAGERQAASQPARRALRVLLARRPCSSERASCARAKAAIISLPRYIQPIASASSARWPSSGRAASNPPRVPSDTS